MTRDVFKILAVVALIVAGIAYYVSSSSLGSFQGRIRQVVDPATIEVTGFNGRRYTVKIVGIRPTNDEASFERALGALSYYSAHGTALHFKVYKEKDRNVLADVFEMGQSSVNVANYLVENGWALWDRDKYPQFERVLKPLEDRARENRLGCWSDQATAGMQ